MASLLKKIVDAEQWDAENIAGRLGMVLHAAFLFAGFQPYGAQPRSGHFLKKQSRKRGGSLCLSREYTAPDLAHHDGADADVLMLCVQGDDGALLVFLITDGGGHDTPENAYLELLDLGTVSPLLSRSLGGVEPYASRICKSLANGVCWGFLDELCRRNGQPLMGLTSLPDDLKGAVLEKLTDGKDLARVECVSSQLRMLVAERDHELWKTLYKALPARERLHRWPFFRKSESSNEKQETVVCTGSSWKNMYVVARRLWSFFRYAVDYDHRKHETINLGSCYFDSSDLIQMIRRMDMDVLSWAHLFTEGSKRFCRIIVRRRKSSRPHEYWLFQLPTEDHPTEEEQMVSMRVERRGTHRQKQAQNDCQKKWNGCSAIHSPSSRYRWKHR